MAAPRRAAPPCYTGRVPPTDPHSAVPRHPPVELTLESDGLRLAALLFLPGEEPPLGALLVCHGAGSRKEKHVVMAEQAAHSGLAAMVFDFPGHGASEGAMDAHADHAVRAAARALLTESAAPWVAGRGSSMGAYWLLRAAAADPGLFRSLVVLCPADEEALLRGLEHFEELSESDDPDVAFCGRFDRDSLRALWLSSRLTDTARGLPRVLVAHARDDDDVPFAVSERLAAVVAPPTRFIALPHGGHKGPQRSASVARATLDWVFQQA